MFTSPSVTIDCFWLLLNFELYRTKFILRIIPRINIPITVQQLSLINQCWVRLRGDTHNKNATKILANSTKMRNNFAIYADDLHPLYL